MSGMAQAKPGRRHRSQARPAGLVKSEDGDPAPRLSHQPARGSFTPSLYASKKKNDCQALHQSSPRTTISRGPTSSTAGTRRSLSTACVCLYSTRISHGRPGSYGETAETSASAFRAPSSISSRAFSGGTFRELSEPSPHFTGTVVTPSPSSAAASRQTASSPVTSTTGQPQLPHNAALIPVSPTSVPLKERFCHDWPETVWFMTPSGVPAIACMPTKSAASQPCSRKAVYSVHSCWTTYSHAGSIRSGTSELNV